MADITDSPSFEKKDLTSFFDLVVDPSNVQKVYMPGEILNGTVQILGKTNVQVDMKIVGELYTIEGDNAVSEVFSSESSLLDIKGGGEGMAEVPFSLILKPDAPSSIATPCGGIKYKVVAAAMIKDPNGGVKPVEKAINLSVITLKQIEHDKNGKRVHADDRSCLYCCFGGISADFEITETALLCGSRAVINARIINSTSKPISMTSVILIQKIIRKKDMRWFKNEVAKIERGSIMPGKHQVWLSERFLIPSLPPTRSDAYFDVSYTFVLTIQKSSSKSMRLKAPITIGNIMGTDLPKNWREADGVEFWSFGDEETMKVSNLPVYVTYCF